MPRNGAGTFALPTNTWNPAVDGVTATSADWQSLIDDVEAALTGSVAADGQTAMTGNLPMGNNRITGLAAASGITDAANANDVQSGRLEYLTSVAGTDTITASLTGFTAYAAGQVFRFVAAGTNTGAVTLNINSVGAKAITKNGTTALGAGDLVSGGAYEVAYDGTRFQVIGMVQLASDAEAQAGTDTARAITPANLKAAQIVLGTATATTSGTTHDRTGIPSFAKRVTIMGRGVSTGGISTFLCRVGDADGVESTGYTGAHIGISDGATPVYVASTAGWAIGSTGAAGDTFNFTATLNKEGGNWWTITGTSWRDGGTDVGFSFSGTKELSDVLTQVRLTTAAGDTFDAGEWNVSWE